MFYYNILQVRRLPKRVGEGYWYFPRYKRGVNDTWHMYHEGGKYTWEEAYAVLEKHANPAALAVRFVGTF